MTDGDRTACSSFPSGGPHAYRIVDSTVRWQQDTCPIDWVDIGYMWHFGMTGLSCQFLELSQENGLVKVGKVQFSEISL